MAEQGRLFSEPPGEFYGLEFDDRVHEDIEALSEAELQDAIKVGVIHASTTLNHIKTYGGIGEEQQERLDASKQRLNQTFGISLRALNVVEQMTIEIAREQDI